VTGRPDTAPEFDGTVLLLPVGGKAAGPAGDALAATTDTADRTDGADGHPGGNGHPGPGADPDPAGPEADAATRLPWMPVVRSALVVTALLCLSLVVQLAWISGLQHRSAQLSLYNRFRTELALGTAPLGPRVSAHRTLSPGTPMALLRIPSIGVDEVVSEGTSGSVLAGGPGHYRSTVFPGGPGTSVILGRAAAYGGPFGRLTELRRGARITVITGVGTSVFRVTDLRRPGDKVRAPAPGTARLTLGTASGSRFVPSGVVWVDARMVGAPQAAQAPAVTTVPASEQPLGIDLGALVALLGWLVLVAVLLGGAVWTWRRRGHAQAWIVFTAPLALVWLMAADQTTRLLPNLL
jgi:hypothetical protein